MPKIIENLRENIIEEAQKQLHENGYAKMTIRSVASALGIGTGTMYNYFKSKDVLISTFMLEDWHKCTAKMRSIKVEDKMEFLEKIYESLKVFVDKYRYIFEDEDAKASFFAVFSQRHIQLRGVIAEIIIPICQDVTDVDSSFLANHIAESMLFWMLEDIPFEKQRTVLEKYF